MNQSQLKHRVQYLHEAVDNNNISWGEIVEIDGIAEQLGIEVDPENMQSTDVLIAIENELKQS